VTKPADRTLSHESPTRDDAPAGGRFGVGAKVGPYSLLEFLGQGAFGEVWLAERDSAIAKSRLAVKLPLHAPVDLNAVRREAEVWVRAGNHPNVLPMFEANVYDGQAVIVSEYAQDGSLKRWLVKHGGSAPSFDVAVDMAMAILAGLEHLHVRGVIHRDLKPTNVLMQGECPRIADFGLARVLDPTATVSSAAGTPPYMAPEAFDGRRSAQTDLWSVGVLLYQLLTGKLPFPSGDLMRLMKAVATEAPAPLPDSIPPQLRRSVWAALEKDPDSRFRSAADMRAALRDTLRQLETQTGPATTLRPRGVRTVAVTGSMQANPRRTAHRVRTLLAPYCGEHTTWYCGTMGTVDECTADYLLGQGQRVIAVGYAAGDISNTISALLTRYAAPFVDAQNEQVPAVPNAPSRRDVFFSTKADLLVLFWDGISSGTAELLAWLRQQGKDHVVGFV
jgi:serine/threonine protein kinase